LPSPDIAIAVRNDSLRAHDPALWAKLNSATGTEHIRSKCTISVPESARRPPMPSLGLDRRAFFSDHGLRARGRKGRPDANMQCRIGAGALVGPTLVDGQPYGRTRAFDGMAVCPGPPGRTRAIKALSGNLAN